MPLQLTADGMRAIFPKAPAVVIDAFVQKQAVLDKAGITHTRPRFADFCANIEHECDGFNVNGFVKNLTENIGAYTHTRMAQVWPNRFNSGSQVAAKFGTAPGWQKKAFDQIYGNRMGNRPNTSDGSRYIGRGGPQWTGRDGYAALQRITGLPAVEQPEVAAKLEVQPEVCSAFWQWKNLSRFSDTGNWIGLVKAWNGGTNGLADRNAKKAGNASAIGRMRILAVAKTMPGEPPTPKPPKDVIADATAPERNARKGGAGAATAGGAGEVAKTTGTVQPDNPVANSYVNYTLIGVGVAIILIATVLIALRVRRVAANWY
jgi:predicted chitinase